MSDFQVFSFIKKYLDDQLKEQAIYFAPHAEMQKPCCVIELEEMWSNTLILQNGIKSRIKFKATCYSDDNLLSSQVSQSQKLINLLDGLTVDLKDGSKAIIKFSETLINTANKSPLQSVSQLFETVVRAA